MRRGGVVVVTANGKPAFEISVRDVSAGEEEAEQTAVVDAAQANSHGAGVCTLSDKCDCIGACKHGRPGHGAGVDRG